MINRTDNRLRHCQSSVFLKITAELKKQFMTETASIIEQFEQAWSDSATPSIAEFLDGDQRLTDDARASLLRELVMVDMELRWKRDLHARAGHGGLGATAVAPSGEDVPARTT